MPIYLEVVFNDIEEVIERHLATEVHAEALDVALVEVVVEPGGQVPHHVPQAFKRITL